MKSGTKLLNSLPNAHFSFIESEMLLLLLLNKIKSLVDVIEPVRSTDCFLPSTVNIVAKIIQLLCCIDESHVFKRILNTLSLRKTKFVGNKIFRK